MSVPSGSVWALHGSARLVGGVWLCLFNKNACTDLVLHMRCGWLAQQTQDGQSFRPASQSGRGGCYASRVLRCGCHLAPLGLGEVLELVSAALYALFCLGHVWGCVWGHGTRAVSRATSALGSCRPASVLGSGIGSGVGRCMHSTVSAYLALLQVCALAGVYGVAVALLQLKLLLARQV